MKASRPRAIPFVVAGGVIAAVIGGVVVWRHGSPNEAPAITAKPSNDPTRSTESTTPPPSTGPAAIQAPASPELPRVRPELPPAPTGSDGQPLSIADQFAAETRDPSWATPTEQAIKARVSDVPAAVATECRQAHCQLTLSGTSANVEKTIALLERAEGGLRDMSKNILLGAPEQRPDGTLALRLYVVFDPPSVTPSPDQRSATRP